ncbi:MAG: GDP-mannose 4,6-dehydratase [Deltaproteobacteria bacterium]|nr:GDP-mannose 4,6-dehydratase [Deltaproteobacteria bacterium]
MKILITGVAGFIGSHLAEALIGQGHQVVGIDNFMDYYPRRFKEKNLEGLRSQPAFEFIEADLLDTDLVALVKPLDSVVHLAAQAGVRASWGENFRTYSDNNILATQQLLEACRGEGIKKFVYASSSSLYGDTDDLPMREESVLSPVSPYGVSKAAGEYLAYLYHKNFGVPTVALRFFTVYGPRQRPDMAFHRFCKAILQQEPLIVWGDGEQSRDFTFIGDIIQGCLRALEAGRAGNVYNIGGGSRHTLNEILEALHRISGRPVRVDYQPVQKGDVRHTSASLEKIKKELGYDPQVSMLEGLEREWEWVRELYSQ